MGNPSFKRITSFVLFWVIFFAHCAIGAENIDPSDNGYQYAYGENAGWLNFEPNQGGGVTVSDTKLTGYVWAENVGWINLSPASFGGVINDGDGNLSGYAWGENVGWINFNPTGSRVTIDSNGNFKGYAWGENIGWIHFSGTAGDSTRYKVKTTWLGADAGDPITPRGGGGGGGGCFISVAGGISYLPK